jgi:NAD(P)-dependent dehydrogenase (short-subunit alcohol dehydrogenase family)
MILAEKVALITGGASGLGLATAMAYVGKGAKVAIFDLNAAQGEEAVRQLGADNTAYWNVDVSDEKAVEDAVAEVVSRFGSIHICNNFAGIGSGQRTLGKKGVHSLELFSRVLNINLVGTFNVCRCVAEQMSRNEELSEGSGRGVIINTASIAAMEGQVGQVAYSASKGGVVSMTLPMARDLASYGIRVNTIVPGLIQTPMFEELPDYQYKSLENSVCFPKRLGAPNEIAHLSVFIVENDYLNGECIRLDGAIRMQPL